MRLLKSLCILSVLTMTPLNAKTLELSCDQEVKNLCEKLYSPQNPLGSGNLDLAYKDGFISLRFGMDERDFYYTRLKLYQARMAAFEKYPNDFKKNLSHYHFIEIAKKYLKTPKNIDLATKGATRTLGEKMFNAWDFAFYDTVDQTMYKKYPRYFTTKHQPLEWQKERTAIEKKLIQKIMTALWANTSQWKKIETLYAELKLLYREEINSIVGLSKDEKNKWIEQLNKTQLTIPGTSDFDANWNDFCASTEWNARYNFYTNQIKICAGQFNTDVSERALAHEMAHSIGSARNKMIAIEETDLAKKIISISKELCEGRQKTCPHQWNEIKKDLLNEKNGLKSLEKYQDNFTPVRSCLQKKTIAPTAPDELNRFVTRQSKVIAEGEASALADQHFFLNAIKPKYILGDGTEINSAYYLNPCGLTEWNRERFNLKQSMEVLFLSEYLCHSNSNVSESHRLQEAIETAITLKSKIYQNVLPMGGRFSEHPSMVAHGLSSDTDEDFADWLSSRVLARYINQQAPLSVESKKNFVLAQIAAFCDTPSNTHSHPVEAAVEKSFSYEPHTINSARIQKILTAPLQDLMGCKPVSSASECRY